MGALCGVANALTEGARCGIGWPAFVLCLTGLNMSCLLPFHKGVCFLVHQVIGCVAITLTFVQLLRGWGAPRVLAFLCGTLGLVGSVLVAASPGGSRVEPRGFSGSSHQLPMPSSEGSVTPMSRVPGSQTAVGAFFP